jgi:succinate dehydrogenase / fumarate reductase cytochrome b subunit
MFTGGCFLNSPTVHGDSPLLVNRPLIGPGITHRLHGGTHRLRRAPNIHPPLIARGIMNRPAGRPLSPHLSIWKWGPHMTVSILHRITGSGMATVGAVLLVWWLAAMAGGAASYAAFIDLFTLQSGALNVVGYVVLIGLTLSFFQHMLTGIRHLVLDTGAGYELRVNKMWATATMILSPILTALFWAYLLTRA